MQALSSSKNVPTVKQGIIGVAWISQPDIAIAAKTFFRVELAKVGVWEGKQDHVSNGTVTLTDDLEGGKKRSGGHLREEEQGVVEGGLF